jgi:hypothetical protein
MADQREEASRVRSADLFGRPPTVAVSLEKLRQAIAWRDRVNLVRQARGLDPIGRADKPILALKKLVGGGP